MTYIINQSPATIKKDIDKLPPEAAAAIFVLLHDMQANGPWPDGYSIKPLKGHLHGINQINMKVNKEQIRILFFVYGDHIVILDAFKKTSPQCEKRAYVLAIQRKNAAMQILLGGSHELSTLH